MSSPGSYNKVLPMRGNEGNHMARLRNGNGLAYSGPFLATHLW